MKISSGRNSALSARRRLGCFSRSSWSGRVGGGIRRTRGRRRILQRQVRAVERGVLCSRSDNDSLNGVAPALQLRERQADAERCRELLRIHFRGSQQRRGIHLQSIAEKDQACAERISVARFFVLPFLRIVSREDNV